MQKQIETKQYKKKIAPLTLPFPSLGNPWTWNLVLITSNGHTKVAASTPDQFPQKSLKIQLKSFPKKLQKKQTFRLKNWPAAAPAPALQRSPLALELCDSAAISATRLKKSRVPITSLGFLSAEGDRCDQESHGQNDAARDRNPRKFKKIDKNQEDSSSEIRVLMGS